MDWLRGENLDGVRGVAMVLGAVLEVRFRAGHIELAMHCVLDDVLPIHLVVAALLLRHLLIAAEAALSIMCVGCVMHWNLYFVSGLASLRDVLGRNCGGRG